MTHAKHVHLHANGRHENADSQLPYWKRAHHDWKFWIALSLMLTAMLVYILTLDLSVQPTAHNQQQIEQALP